MPTKKLLQAFMLPALLFSCLISFSQNRTVTGKITAPNGNGVANATVSVKNSTTGTTTANDGSFTLSVPAGTNSIVVSSIGYVSQEVDITAKNSVTVKLEINTSTMDEVVMIAYGTRKKGDLTGSVTSLTEKDFQKGQIASSEQLLVGKVAGLQVTSGGG
ncbi:MAG TPA: carboxypeptidase-like regulatory domain-containing protein, partial [Chitinophagaceae bacterium]